MFSALSTYLSQAAFVFWSRKVAEIDFLAQNDRIGHIHIRLMKQNMAESRWFSRSSRKTGSLFYTPFIGVFPVRWQSLSQKSDGLMIFKISGKLVKFGKYAQTESRVFAAFSNH
jgi:hypothetical protein